MENHEQASVARHSAIGDDHLVDDLAGERDAPGDSAPITALDQHPGRSAIRPRRDRSGTEAETPVPTNPCVFCTDRLGPASSNFAHRSVLGVYVAEVAGLARHTESHSTETVLRRRRHPIALIWKYRSHGRWRAGRPGIALETRQLIREIARANFLWGAPRIHGELLKLGVTVSQATKLYHYIAIYAALAKRPLLTGVVHIYKEPSDHHCPRPQFQRT
jgi:hypothetical protein